MQPFAFLGIANWHKNLANIYFHNPPNMITHHPVTSADWQDSSHLIQWSIWFAQDSIPTPIILIVLIGKTGFWWCCDWRWAHQRKTIPSEWIRLLTQGEFLPENLVLAGESCIHLHALASPQSHWLNRYFIHSGSLLLLPLLILNAEKKQQTKTKQTTADRISANRQSEASYCC